MRAICIDSDFTHEIFHVPEFNKYVTQIPKKGQIYNIEIRKCDMGYEGVVLTDIDCGTLPNGKPVAFRKDRFQILEEELELIAKQNQNQN